MSRQHSRVARAFVSLAAILLLAGCRSPQVKNSPEAPSATADGALTVVGWSLRDQSPLGVQGIVKSESNREIASFDTRLDPSRGKTFEHLPAGHYKIEITHRFAADRTIAASGADEVDVQPGERARREVVIDDRDDGSLTAGAPRR